MKNSLLEHPGWKKKYGNEKFTCYSSAANNYSPPFFFFNVCHLYDKSDD